MASNCAFMRGVGWLASENSINLNDNKKKLLIIFIFRHVSYLLGRKEVGGWYAGTDTSSNKEDGIS
jgi:hypothetical protein